MWLSIAISALAVSLMVRAGPALAERRETSAGPVDVTQKMVAGLDTTWAIGFVPDGDHLIFERGGRLVLVRDGRWVPVSGTPRVHAEGQGGLLDVAVSRSFKRTREICLTFSEPRRRGAVTRWWSGVSASTPLG